jgi:hypothetical protein
LRDLRKRSGFAAVPRGPWQVFIAIACYWQANAEAWPSQETIATFTGYVSAVDAAHALNDFRDARSSALRSPSSPQ